MTIGQITFWNRSTQQLEEERVYGDGAIRWLYQTQLGQLLSRTLVSRHWVSAMYGAVQNSAWSAGKIAPFIRDFEIPMHEYEAGPFPSFNAFFIRQFRDGARRFVSDPGALAAPAEARYLAVEALRADATVRVKGVALSATQLIGDAAMAAPFVGGPALIARLCPVDYHRFHFPADGVIAATARRAGPLHSVNPVALAYKPDVLMTNERQVTVIETEAFGRLAYVEIGATFVGTIVQSHDSTTPVKRGDEKGYFLFGGSSVVLLGEPNRWRPDGDLLDRSREGIETLVRLGEQVGLAAP